ncbi:MAG TPA: C1 family peptidase [Thermoanaerobaculia bacterium]|nr:C1 family peptidase [Thermoanaerobaculia bacterium]
MAATAKRRTFQPTKGRGKAKGKLPELRLGTGWLPEPPDERDLTVDHQPLQGMLAKLRLGRMIVKKVLPPKVDLSKWAGPVQFQGGFNTCNAHVVAGLVTYFERKAHGNEIAPSRLFLYKVAKNFLQATDNAGVYIRQVMGVLKLVGVPPEKYWPYPDPGTYQKPRSSDPLLDAEPSSFCYAIANDYRAITYYRLDEPDQRPAALLHLAKAHLVAQVPFAFGFPLYQLLGEATTTGRIPYPSAEQAPLANHAVVAMGYDDDIVIGKGIKGAAATRGAIRIKNSWSESWGEKGYGWLPYEYVLQGHTRDFWTLLRSEWVDTGAFQLIS